MITGTSSRGTTRSSSAEAAFGETIPGRVHLGTADRGHGVDNLTVEVAEVHLVVVHHGDPADARGGQIEQDRRAQPPGAHDEDRRGPQPALPLVADRAEEQVPGVARALVGGELGARLDQRRQGRARPGAHRAAAAPSGNGHAL